MKLSFFGQFLVEQELITTEQLSRALALKGKSNKMLGTLAVEAQWMTDEQVKQIREQQRVEDAMFGEIAVEKGYLTGEQLEELLRRQADNNLRVGDAVRQLNLLEDTVVESAWAKYAINYQAGPLDTDSFEQPLVSYAIENFCRVVTRMCAVPIKSGVVRRWDPDEQLPFTYSIPLIGDMPMVLGLSLSRAMAAEIVAGMMAFGEDDYEAIEEELIDDVCAELLNILAGQIAIYAEKWDTQLKLGLPGKGFVPERALSTHLITPGGGGVFIVKYGH